MSNLQNKHIENHILLAICKISQKSRNINLKMNTNSSTCIQKQETMCSIFYMEISLIYARKETILFCTRPDALSGLKHPFKERIKDYYV